jgi:hypothetical protein
MTYGAGHLVTATFGQPPIWPGRHQLHWPKSPTNHVWVKKFDINVVARRKLVSVDGVE